MIQVTLIQLPQQDEEFSLKVEGQPGWLHPTQTLPEQNVDERAVIVLRKKYFSSDNTVDRSDPVQLHYLYVQCREMVISGQLPTNYEEACQLAGLQLQIDYGNFVPENHRYGWFQERLEQMASPNHIRMKNFDKDVLHQWKQVTGMQQLNGKYRYVQLVRSLKAFGITCYEVEEKVPNGKGMRRIILGIAAERIYRMDLNTKETLSQHSITHLRRFAAGPKTITLDFADYESDYSTFKTDKGEEILQLISGYIDIYLKKRASVGQVVKDDDAESAEVSEIAPIVGFASTTYTSTVGVDATSLMIGEQGRFTTAGLRPSYNAQMPGTMELQNRQQQRKSVRPCSTVCVCVCVCVHVCIVCIQPGARRCMAVRPTRWRATRSSCATSTRSWTCWASRTRACRAQRSATRTSRSRWQSRQAWPWRRSTSSRRCLRTTPTRPHRARSSRSCSTR